MKTTKMTKQEIIEKVKNEDRLSFIVCNEWLVQTYGGKMSVQHTYFYKGEEFDNLKEGIKYLRTKLNYLVKRGDDLQIKKY